MPTESRAPLRVAAVVAAFHPEADLAVTVAGLLTAFDHVLVVDDGSPAAFSGVLDEIVAAGATVVRRPSNEGIAASLNAGVERADALWRPDFFATFDQDSVPVSDYADRAVATYRDAKRSGLNVGFVVASSYSGHPVHTRRSSAAFTEAFDPMQSGFVVPRETFDSLGRFEQGLVIDGVDSEFTARARAAGLDVLVGAGCDIRHQLGRRDPARLFGKELRVLGRVISYNYHSPQRVYYIARNGTTLTRRYLAKDPSWVLRRLVEETKAHLLRLAFSPERRVLARAMLAGYADSLRGRSGKIEATLLRRLG